MLSTVRGPGSSSSDVTASSITPGVLTTRERIQVMMPLFYAEISHQNELSLADWEDLYEAGEFRTLIEIDFFNPKKTFLKALAREPSLDEASLQNHREKLESTLGWKNLLVNRGLYFTKDLQVSATFVLKSAFNYDMFCYIRYLASISTLRSSLLQWLYDTVDKQTEWTAMLRTFIFYQDGISSFSDPDGVFFSSENPTTPLHLAVVLNDLTSLNKLLNQFPEALNAKDRVGDTLATLAVRCGHLDILRRLISLGIHLNEDNTTEKLPLLYFALQIGHEEMVSTLLGIDTVTNSLQNNPAFNPLHIAFQYGHPRIVSMLLEKGFPLGSYHPYFDIYSDPYSTNKGINYANILNVKRAFCLGLLFDAGLYVRPTKDTLIVLNNIAEENRQSQLAFRYPGEKHFIQNYQLEHPEEPPLTLEQAQPLMLSAQREAAAKIINESMPDSELSVQTPSLFNLLMDKFELNRSKMPFAYEKLSGKSYIHGRTDEASECDWERFEQEFIDRTEMGLSPENAVYQNWLKSLEHAQQYQPPEAASSQDSNEMSPEIQLLERYTRYQERTKVKRLELLNASLLEELNAVKLELMALKEQTMQPAASTSTTQSRTSSTSFMTAMTFFKTQEQQMLARLQDSRSSAQNRNINP